MARIPRLLIAGLLLFMLARMISSAWIESPTNDEPANIPSGYVYLLRGDYIDGTHPPLLRYWAAIPLLIMHPNDFPGDKSWFQLWVGSRWLSRPSFGRNRNQGEAALVE